MEQTPWAGSFKTLIKDAVQLKQATPFYGKDHPDARDIELRADQIFLPDKLLPLLAEPLLNKQTITFFKQLAKLRNILFPFLYDKDVRWIVTE